VKRSPLAIVSILGGCYMAQSAQPGAVRLIFEYDGDEIRLIGQQRVDVAVTGLEVAPEVRSGHFVEVRGARGEGLSRVPIRTAFDDSVEVFPEDHVEPISRVPIASRAGAFTVVVPARPNAESVAVIRVDASPPTDLSVSPPPAETVDLATFALES